MPQIAQAFLGSTELKRGFLGSTLLFDNTAAEPFTDDFNRADQSLEASDDWTRVGGSAGDATVSSNVVAFHSADGVGAAYLCPDQGTADHYTQIVRQPGDVSSEYFDCCVRLTDGNNFIGCRWRVFDSQWQLYKRVSGTFTLLGTSASPTPSGGEVVRVEADGDQITVLVNGSPIIGPITETDHQSVTRQGFISRNHAQDPVLDNFEAGVMQADGGNGDGELQTVALPAPGDWTDHGVVLTTGSSGEWDFNVIATSEVVEKDGTLYAYYIGSDAERDDGGPAHRAVGVATSTDGETWTKHASNPIVTFQPDGDGGSNPEEEGVQTVRCGLTPDGTFHLVWGGNTAISPTQVRIDHYYSTSSDGVNFTNDDAATANRIVDVFTDTDFAGHFSNPDAEEDESWPHEAFWDAEAGEFQYLYTTKGGVRLGTYHVNGADLENLDGANSDLIIGLDNPQSGDVHEPVFIIDRGNDNIDYFSCVNGDPNNRGVIYRWPITNRDFKNPGNPVEFYNFNDEDGASSARRAQMVVSRNLNKWVMLWRESGVQEVRVKTAPLEFET